MPRPQGKDTRFTYISHQSGLSILVLIIERNGTIRRMRHSQYHIHKILSLKYILYNTSTKYASVLSSHLSLWTEVNTAFKFRNKKLRVTSDYEECRLLGYKNQVRTSQETHYVSATETSQLMLCKI
jgi:hypothetical protein